MKHRKTSVVREMMPKDLKREFLTGPRKFDEIMDKLDFIVNEMMADDGPMTMDLGSVGAYDAKTTLSDLDTSNDMSYKDVCAIAWKGYKAGKEAGKREQTDREHGIVEKELIIGRVGEMMEATMEARRAPRAANLIGTATRTREAIGATGKARAKARESETRNGISG